MKKIFSRQSLQKLNRLALLISSALLSHQSAIYAVEQTGFDLYSSLQRAGNSNDTDKPARELPAGYHSLSKLIFPIDDTPLTNEPAKETVGTTKELPSFTSSAVIAQESQEVQAPKATNSPAAAPAAEVAPPKTILINFNNVAIIEYIRFISRLTGKNFIFDENDLQFNVTIISEEPATIENIMTALLQELRIHDLSLLEQGNNLIIHKNTKVTGISKVISDGASANSSSSEIVTQVFKLNTADPTKVAAVIKPLTSDVALVEVLAGTNHLIITDLSANVAQIAKLIKSVDAPSSGLVVGLCRQDNIPIFTDRYGHKDHQPYFSGSGLHDGSMGCI
jgi:type III secretion protein C